MSLSPLLLCALAALVAFTAPAPAQQGDATYPVDQLAGILGELHGINVLCRGSGAQEWRRRMEQLLELEAPMAGTQRDRLIARFNEGFRYHQQRRTRCGAESELESERLASQGEALAETLRRHYAD